MFGFTMLQHPRSLVKLIRYSGSCTMVNAKVIMCTGLGGNSLLLNVTSIFSLSRLLCPTCLVALCLRKSALQGTITLPRLRKTHHLPHSTLQPFWLCPLPFLPSILPSNTPNLTIILHDTYVYDIISGNGSATGQNNSSPLPPDI